MKSILFLFTAAIASAQNYPYVISTVAGVNPLGDGGAATNALLEAPTGVGVDPSTGIIYVNDLINNRLRQISSAGAISAFVNGYIADFKLDSAGNIYAVDGGIKSTRSLRKGASA